jgi:hypothetical protein
MPSAVEPDEDRRSRDADSNADTRATDIVGPEQSRRRVFRASRPDGEQKLTRRRIGITPAH